MTTTADSAFRCAGASLLDTEPMAGSAPTEAAWLFVEQPGPWGRQAVAESRLPEAVRDHLAGIAARHGVRVQLIRRHGGTSGPGVRVFSAVLGDRPVLRTALLADPGELLASTATVADDPLGHLAWEPYAGPLWLVCTNGRRDLCCAERGRPVTAALADRWPEATWETSHLGGHRFSGTLLALPAGVVLGRLDPASAVEACAALEAGRLPAHLARGRSGLPGAAQVAELHLRAELGLDRLDDVRVVAVESGRVRLEAGGAAYLVDVEESLGAPRRQSCADLRTKAAPVYAVVGWVQDRMIADPFPSDQH
ncbi:sucrase ferredoxin [Nocardioides sp.]|uniref:sucrase ferredoxin n=1 Tax=Nocardioides sp. TaxID=35761 RepID=UPI00261A5D09|nr:sucrase ferredoxin [Nocardioides sp.]MDI6908756.1 sucrase ferredoxin [Nocardioides sp.]